MSDWQTYAQAGERFGVSAEAVRLRARRLGWRTQPGNDGRTLVLVPDNAASPRLHRGGDAVAKPAQPGRGAIVFMHLHVYRHVSEAGMSKKLTITVDAEVYDGLHSVIGRRRIGRRRISRVLNDLARPHVVGQDRSAGYTAMAADEAREAEAEAWSEALVGDVAEEPRRHGG
jgi:hypothetical protein